MNTTALEQRITTLEDRLNDTPERRAAERAAAGETAYLARLDKALSRFRMDIKGIAAYLRMRIRHEVEQATRQLGILHTQGRMVQHQQAVDALGRLPREIALEILSPKFPTPSVYWMSYSTTDEVEAAKARKAYLEQHREDFLEQAVSELLEAIEAT